MQKDKRPGKAGAVVRTSRWDDGLAMHTLLLFRGIRGRETPIAHRACTGWCAKPAHMHTLSGFLTGSHDSPSGIARLPTTSQVGSRGMLRGAAVSHRITHGMWQDVTGFPW